MIENSAANEQRPSRSFLRFGLRTLIIGVAVVALLFVGSRRFYDWYTSISISQAVAGFNQRQENSRPEYGGPLSENEIVSAIETHLRTLAADEEVKAILTRISRTRRIPDDATLDAFRVVDPAGKTYAARTKLWCINLSVVTGPKSGYGLRIRETEPAE